MGYNILLITSVSIKEQTDHHC